MPARKNPGSANLGHWWIWCPRKHPPLPKFWTSTAACWFHIRPKPALRLMVACEKMAFRLFQARCCSITLSSSSSVSLTLSCSRFARQRVQFAGAFCATRAGIRRLEQIVLLFGWRIFGVCMPDMVVLPVMAMEALPAGGRALAFGSSKAISKGLHDMQPLLPRCIILPSLEICGFL